MRRSLRGVRDEKDFRTAQAELTQLRAAAAGGEFDLYYYDEAGFSLEPCVPYAWQPQGETLELPSAASERLNVLGFLRHDHEFQSFVFAGPIDSQVVISCFDRLSRGLRQLALVVIDNAPTHTSAAFEARRAEWEGRGLYVMFLPPYCPELNLIEVLWRKLKYEWLPLNAYRSFKDLAKALCRTLSQVGSKYRIAFA